MTADGSRAPRIVSLLQWAHLRLGLDVARVAVDKWVQYILDERGAWETGVRVFALPTSFVALAAADLVQPWATWSPH